MAVVQPADIPVMPPVAKVRVTVLAWAVGPTVGLALRWYRMAVATFKPSIPFWVSFAGVAHSVAAIESVTVVPAAVQTETYSGSVPVGIALVQPFSSASVAGVVMEPEENVQVTAPGPFVVGAHPAIRSVALRLYA